MCIFIPIFAQLPPLEQPREGQRTDKKQTVTKKSNILFCLFVQQNNTTNIWHLLFYFRLRQQFIAKIEAKKIVDKDSIFLYSSIQAKNGEIRHRNYICFTRFLLVAVGSEKKVKFFLSFNCLWLFFDVFFRWLRWWTVDRYRRSELWYDF